MDTCRLLLEALQSEPADGVRHMAVDEALLRTAADSGQTTLRFYRWKPATLSLGYFQSASQRDSHAASQSCPVVRRASGGGAIVHDQELTYSFATPTRSRFGDAETLYWHFHETLVDLLHARGVPASLQPETLRQVSERFLCFRRRSRGDVLVGDHKVVGSAQRRWQQAVIQHGSILLQTSAFAPELPGIQCLYPGAWDASEWIPRWLEMLQSRLKTAFRQAELSDKEEDLAAELATTKFGTDSWTCRR